jgi:hypothetical protein
MGLYDYAANGLDTPFIGTQLGGGLPKETPLSSMERKRLLFVAPEPADHDQ